MPVEFLKHLPEAASSPLAFVAYGLVVAAWVVQAWLAQNPRRSAQKILERFKDDTQRSKALAEIFQEQPPRGLSGNEAILQWVNIRSREKAKQLLLVAWVATVLALLLFLVAVYSHVSTATRQVTLHLQRVGTDRDCPALPDSARVVVTRDADKTSLGELRVNAPCVALLPLPASVTGPVSFELRNAEGYSISDPHGYDLGGTEIVLSISTTGQARVRVSIFQYSAIQCPDAGTAFDTFENILRSKAVSLRGMFDSSDHRYDYLSEVEVVPARMAMNLDAKGIRDYWRRTGSLQVLTGACTRQQDSMHMLSQVFFGGLGGGLPEPFRADLPISAEEFGAVRDIHTASILYALAQDARQRNADRDLTISYLSRSKELLGRLTPDAANQLLSALDNTLQAVGAPARMGL